MDTDMDEERIFSEDSDNELQNQSNEPWQCGLANLEERAMALYRNGHFTDITLTFPGSDITYDAHRLILAISSPVFEGILYGPMRTEGRNVELHDDDPLNIEYILAHFYGIDLEIPDMDTALEVFKLADKYILDELKNHCCKQILFHMSKDNIKNVFDFAERFNFTDLKSNCLPILIDVFEELYERRYQSKCCEDEPNYTMVSTNLMVLKDDWIEELLPEVSVGVLDFQESWRNPESSLKCNRLSTILSSRRCCLDKFYGCINAENIHQFPLEYDLGEISYTLELCLSVTDPHHAKRVIEAINQQNRFEKHLIAIHIRSGEVWPRNWSPLPTERTHRPSMLLISDTDDDKVAWVIEAAKALLPQSEGSYTKEFKYNGRYDDEGLRKIDRLKPYNILKLPRSRFTLNGFITMVQGLFTTGIIFTRIQVQSPYISNARVVFMQFAPKIQRQCVSMDHHHDFFRKVFEDFPNMNQGRGYRTSF